MRPDVHVSIRSIPTISSQGQTRTSDRRARRTVRSHIYQVPSHPPPPNPRDSRTDPWKPTHMRDHTEHIQYIRILSVDRGEESGRFRRYSYAACTLRCSGAYSRVRSNYRRRSHTMPSICVSRRKATACLVRVRTPHARPRTDGNAQLSSCAAIEDASTSADNSVPQSRQP
ncbi:hypothetical protein PYCCODRAFT_776233 [Trametes coccinea BRFM310]|uniref:Uncharacterized protein n=1 Tax=Trametes coccinea (strain BRFM310) TaxID=1353009 RepID=A0A1Y2J0D6_TRAC3|nr:hypothetical protein PYCCODRAFT_776233 [Trametes coccinea BRFM310]